MTLIEVMIVLAIVSMFMTGVVVAARSVAKSDLRASASKMASGIRYLFDRARSTGKYYRLVFDLDNGRYWAESSDDRFMMLREKERGGERGRGLTDEEREASKIGGPSAGAVKKISTTQPANASAAAASDVAGTGDSNEDLVDDHGNLKLGQPKAVFKSFKDTMLKSIDVKKGIQIADVYTPRQRDPYTKGRAYLYFFPQGFGERAVVHLSDGKDNFYSLLVHPLTGRVQVTSGYLEITRDFDRRDDTGNVERER
jgi:general secretion pathway protein H